MLVSVRCCTLWCSQSGACVTQHNPASVSNAWPPANVPKKRHGPTERSFVSGAEEPIPCLLAFAHARQTHSAALHKGWCTAAAVLLYFCTTLVAWLDLRGETSRDTWRVGSRHLAWDTDVGAALLLNAGLVRLPYPKPHQVSQWTIEVPGGPWCLALPCRPCPICLHGAHSRPG